MTIDELWETHLKNDLPTETPGWSEVMTFNAKNSFYTGAACFGVVMSEIIKQPKEDRSKLYCNLLGTIKDALDSLDEDRNKL